jgi:large subunit ribosomal protein L29
MEKASELRERSGEELREMAGNLRAEVFNLRFQKHTEQLEKTSLLREKRRDLAKVLTILRESELELTHANG